MWNRLAFCGNAVTDPLVLQCTTDSFFFMRDVDSSLLGFYGVLIGKHLPMFWRCIMLTCSGSSCLTLHVFFWLALGIGIFYTVLSVCAQSFFLKCILVLLLFSAVVRCILLCCYMTKIVIGKEIKMRGSSSPALRRWCFLFTFCCMLVNFIWM